jgi:hypothetical protein
MEILKCPMIKHCSNGSLNVFDDDTVLTISLFCTYPTSGDILQFKLALKRYLITYSFYSVDEFLMFTSKS